MYQYSGLQGGRPAFEPDQERFSTNRRTGRTAIAQGPITLTRRTTHDVPSAAITATCVSTT
jgi:hypothetical protein